MKIRQLIWLPLLALLLTGCGQSQDQSKAESYSSQAAKIAKTNSAAREDLTDTRSENDATEAAISSMSTRLAKAASTPKSKAKPKAKAKSKTSLAGKNYAGTQEITVNGNNPGFTKGQLSLSRGAWESYANLDGENRAVVADAMLNRSLMPTQKREPLTWDPTGWRNKRTAHGWLYNRSHLIGFQLSGENNNPKNLITGTQSLNNPLMLAHEMDLATYLKASTRHFVRYEVRPIYRGSELVARGVQMRAQSIGDNTIHFNVYIFNVEAGYKINYSDGTSMKQ